MDAGLGLKTSITRYSGFKIQMVQWKNSQYTRKDNLVETKIENGKLIISLPLQQPQSSKSGKTFIVAGTGGFVKTTCTVDNKVVSVAVNATIPK